MRNEPDHQPGAFSGKPVRGLGGNKRAHGGPLTRFVGTAAHASQASAALPATHPAVVEGRTLFPTRVVGADEAPRVLVSGHNSAKIGARITKGAWAGMPVVTLTLEERATCPSSCGLYRECFGNAMPYARRHRVDAALFRALDAELRALALANPAGFAVRVHVLGDFQDVEYLRAWVRWMAAIPQLHVWTYTAHRRESPLGQLIAEANEFWPDRWVVRFSVPAGEQPGPHQATTIWRQPEAAVVPEGIVCPAQIHSTAACATCALCWSPAAAEKRIVFIGHGKRGRSAAPGGDMDATAPSMADAGDDLAPEVVLDLVRRALEGRTSAAAVDAAREEGYRAGYTEGRLEARREWTDRLRALIGGSGAAIDEASRITPVQPPFWPASTDATVLAQGIAPEPKGQPFGFAAAPAEEFPQGSIDPASAPATHGGDDAIEQPAAQPSCAAADAAEADARAGVAAEQPQSAGAGLSGAQPGGEPPAPPEPPSPKPVNPAIAWRTDARRDRLCLEFEAGREMTVIREMLAAMPGPAMPTINAPMWAWVTALKLRRDASVVVPQARTPAPATEPTHDWKTPDRLAAVLRLWPDASISQRGIWSALADIPGPAMPADAGNLRHWADQLKLSARPAIAPQPQAVAVSNVARGVDAAQARTAETPTAPPRLPAPSNGRVFASYREIKAWAACIGIEYDGGNIDAVNRRRKTMSLAPLVQDEDRTAADTQAA